MNKKGISGIVLTVIMVGLVLVAAGVVWVVFSNVLEGQSEALDYNEKCTGLILDVTVDENSCLDLVGHDGECNVTIERAAGSKGDAFDGVEVSIANGNQIEYVEGNIAASKLVSIATDAVTEDADVRIYFNKSEDETHFCSNVFSAE